MENLKVNTHTKPNYIQEFYRLKKNNHKRHKNEDTPLKIKNRDELNFVNIEPEKDAADLPSQKYKYYDLHREQELFNPKEDIRSQYRYLQYSDNDVPLADELWMGRDIKQRNLENIQSLISPNTKIQAFESIHSPWLGIKQIDAKAKLLKFIDSARQRIIEISGNKDFVQQIFKDCTIIEYGKFQVNQTLCNFAIIILENSEEKTWGETERSIIKELKIPIFKNTYGAIFSQKYYLAQKAYLVKCSNTEILTLLKKINPIDIYNLRTIL